MVLHAGNRGNMNGGGQSQYEYSVLSTSITSSELGLDAFDANDDDPLNNDYDSSVDEKNLIKNTTVPQDRYRFVQTTFLLLGIAALMPWNFFITANDYWMYKFRNTSNDAHHREATDDRTPLQTYFASYLTIGTACPFILVVFLNTVIGKKISQNIRNGGSLLVMIVVFVITTAFTLINSDDWQKTFFAIIMVIVVITNAVSGIMQAGVGGLTSMFPPNCIHANVNGQAVAGVFASVAQIITLIDHTDPVKSAFAYFLCAVIFLIAAFVCYILIQRTAFFQFFTSYGNGIVSSAGKIPLTEMGSVVDTSLIGTWKKVWPYALTNALIFGITIGMFPSVASLVVSSSTEKSLWTTTFFIPVCCFLLYNLVDLGGRLIAKWLPLPREKSDRYLLIGSALRVVFIPLFMLCNAKPRKHLPVVFANDAYYILFIMLFGLTNGYFFLNTMAYGPQQVGPLHQEQVGFILTAFIGVGLAFGSVISYISVRLL